MTAAAAGLEKSFQKQLHSHHIKKSDGNMQERETNTCKKEKPLPSVSARALCRLAPQKVWRFRQTCPPCMEALARGVWYRSFEWVLLLFCLVQTSNKECRYRKCRFQAISNSAHNAAYNRARILRTGSCPALRRDSWIRTGVREIIAIEPLLLRKDPFKKHQNELKEKPYTPKPNKRRSRVAPFQ